MTSKKVFTLIGLITFDLILFAITLFLQIIGYRTSPKVFANSEEELNTLLDKAISSYNQTYFVEIGIIGILLFGTNYWGIKKVVNSPFKITLIVFALYLIISIMGLLWLSEKFRTNHF